MKRKKVSAIKVIGPIHQEKNISTGVILSEVILGGQDGLVNTLGVILGLVAASADLRLIVAGGLAGAITEAISMGAVGYTSKVAERDYYLGELENERLEVENRPEEEVEEVRQIYAKKGFKGSLLDEMVRVITSDRELWLETMMREKLNLAPIEGKNPLNSALLIGGTSFLGAAIPLLPFAVFYFLGWRFSGAIVWAICLALGVSALILFLTGVIKAKLTIGKWYRSGVQMLLIGMLSALAGYVIGSLFSI